MPSQFTVDTFERSCSRITSLLLYELFVRTPGYAGVNIFGLTLGISSFLLILMVIQFELNFDKIHRDSDRIVRINNELQLSSGNYKYPNSNGAYGPALMNEMPEVTDFVRLSGGGQKLIFEVETELFSEEHLFFC